MNSFIKVILVGFVAGFSLWVASWSAKHWQTKEDVLAFGVSCMDSPYTYINKQGDWDGFDIDLAHKLARKLGKKIVFKDMPVDLLRLMLRTDQIDVIGCSFVISPKKLAIIDMIDIYGKPKAEITLIFWNKIPEDIETIEDLKRLSLITPIAAKADSAFAELLAEHGITNVMVLTYCQDLVVPLKYGQVLAIIVGPRHALVLQKKYPEIKLLKMALDKPWADGIGIGLKKGNIALKEKLAKAVDELKNDGTIEKLKRKWFGQAVL